MTWIQTHTGLPVELFSPKPDDFEIEDIAQALALQCRFNGHVDHFYSIAEHSVRCSILLEEWGEPPEIQFAGLMHDAAEAYIGDVVGPLKRELDELGDVEFAIEKELFWKFDVPFPLPPAVIKADRVMLQVERRALKRASPRPWSEDDLELPAWTITTETPWRSARANFLARYDIYRP